MHASKYILFVILINCFLINLQAQEQGKSDFSGKPFYKIVKQVKDTPQKEGFPVFEPVKTEDSLISQLGEILGKGFCHQVIKLHRYAKNYLLNVEAPAKNNKWYDGLKEPTYLLLSTQDGGYARKGFWLKVNGEFVDKREVQYVDLVVSERNLTSGNFEEIFPHELGHAIMADLIYNFKLDEDGESLKPLSHKMHMSMAITDYNVAFNEGWGLHFQPLSVDLTMNESLKNEHNYTLLNQDISSTWHSNYDRQLRYFGVKQNLFIYHTALPDEILNGEDFYAAYLYHVTSGSFLPERIKNAQQMMSSEGVISTLFYRIVTSEKLKSIYRENSFYAPFFLPDKKISSPYTPEKLLNGYENVNLKLFYIFHKYLNKLRAKSGEAVPWFTELVKAYAQEFPEEKSEIYNIFISITRGITVFNQSRDIFRDFHLAGRTGNIKESRKTFQAVQNFFRRMLLKLLDDEIKLDENLGPEIWLWNDDFLISEAVFYQERNVPYTLNINSATFFEFMTIRGVYKPLAQRIIAERDKRGYFKNIDELKAVEGVTPELLSMLNSMHEKMFNELRRD